MHILAMKVTKEWSKTSKDPMNFLSPNVINLEPSWYGRAQQSWL